MNRQLHILTQRRRSQRGVALVIALVFLLILTILGITAMQTATMQERMSGNVRARNVALQAAEVALRAGERELEEAVLPPSAATGTHYYDTLEQDLGGNDVQWWYEFDWDNDGGVAIVEVEGARDARYVIEEMTVFAPGGVSVTGEAFEDQNFYRITARGIGTTEGSLVFLQTTFRY